MKTIAITGASGFIASALIPRLKANGYTLVLFGRDAAALQARYPADTVHDYSNFLTHARGCDAVLHMAVLNNHRAASNAEFKAANVDFLIALARQAQEAGVPLFINVTTLQALVAPLRSAYAATKRHGEHALAQIPGLAFTNLRLPAVYTDQFRGKLARLNALPKALRGAALKALAALRPTLHIDTLMDGLQPLLTANPAEAPRELLLSDGQAGNPFYHALRRTVDIGFSLCVLLFGWWLLIGCWIAVALTSPGPAIFAQKRVGRGGRVFTCYKFRTMRMGVKQAATHELSADAVTKFGHFMRRTKIDELPQIVNLLRNEMSLVGPRPCLPSQSELIGWRERLGVLAINPGITGLAQVEGVDMSRPETLARLDAQYVRRQCFLLDMKIMLATVKGSGAQDRVQQA